MSSILQGSRNDAEDLEYARQGLGARNGRMSQRASVQLDGPIFMQTCVLTWMHTPDAGYTQLRHTAARMARSCEQPSD
jgi:hypothetical protein